MTHPQTGVTAAAADTLTAHARRRREAAARSRARGHGRTWTNVPANTPDIAGVVEQLAVTR